MAIHNQVQLITYPDSLGGSLQTLNRVLDEHFSDIFKGGIHILPPFPSSGDRGFAPLTYFEIEPAFGAWEDIRAIGAKHDVLLDVMVNHISRQSEYFQDFLRQGRRSPYADLFLTLDKIWAGGQPVQADIDKMFLRRPLPYSTFTIEETGEEEQVWTTFGKTDPSEQIDLDIHSDKVKRLLADTCLERGSNLSLIVSGEHKAEDGFDVHQIRCSYYSVLNSDDDAYLAARAIQFFAPGIPQVYYVGLLAGENDEEGVRHTGEGREINRHNFSIDEIEQALGKSAVQRLLALIRFRNEYGAFNGDFRVLEAASNEVRLEWTKGDLRCTLHIDLSTNRTVIDYVETEGMSVQFEV
ncbi:alpha-amylase family glycosyl hydrolase [Paenibacillus sonchi]|uniref:alpha-amylase family glycosyl hydrolase n=1 Tax=Paenibacillus sonchi TaxID=373687 RepID=UPI001E53DD5D|nr:hypothetical protein [Paenibacillus sonchi]